MTVPEKSEIEMAMYDAQMGKAYAGCGCATCKELNVKCEDCSVCLESSKSYNSEDEEEEKWDNIAKACWVGYTQRGMKPGRNGGMVPNCVPVGKSDDVQKAKSISVGDHVQFAVPKPPQKTEYAHGVVERIERSGKVTLPGTSETVDASSDNPVAVIRVYASTSTSGENGKRVKTDRRVVKPFSALRVEKEPIMSEKNYELGIEKSTARMNELVDEYNKGKEGNKRISVGTLQAVYRRGIGAYRGNPSSVRGNVSSPQQWAMARVNAFMAGLRGKFPRKAFDTDLFPKGHPRASSKKMFSGFAKDVSRSERVTDWEPLR